MNDEIEKKKRMMTASLYDILARGAGFLIVCGLLSACAEQGALSGGFETHDTSQMVSMAKKPNARTPQLAVVTVPDLIIPLGLVGMSQGDVKNEMGAPHLLREDFGAQVWQYTDDNCVLLLYLYKDAARVYRVTHMETRSKNTAQGAPRHCVSST